jgi:archaellum component FlaC
MRFVPRSFYIDVKQKPENMPDIKELETSVQNIIEFWTEQPDTEEKIQALKEIEESLKRFNEKIKNLLSNY